MDNTNFSQLLKTITLLESPNDPVGELVKKIEQYSRSRTGQPVNKSDVLTAIKRYCTDNNISKKEMEAAFTLASSRTGNPLNPTTLEKIQKTLVNAAKNNPKLATVLGAATVAFGGYEANNLYQSISNTVGEIENKGIVQSISDWWSTDDHKMSASEIEELQQVLAVLQTIENPTQDDITLMNDAQAKIDEYYGN